MGQDEQLIDQIVAGILARLGQPTAIAQPVSDATSVETKAARPEPATIVWNENVITGDQVNERFKGNTKLAGVLHIGKQTILTPSALDVLRSKGVNWKRVSETTQQTAAIVSQTWKIILQHVTPPVKTVMEELKTTGSVKWIQEITGTLDEGIATAVTPLSRAEVDGVMMLTDRPHAAACLANRHAVLRAAVVKEFSDVALLKRELDPNMFCLTPKGWGGFALRKVILACVEG